MTSTSRSQWRWNPFSARDRTEKSATTDSAVQSRGADPTVDVVNAGVVFTEFTEKELQAELDRRTRLESRGLSVLTTSSTLVTLLAALGVVATGTGELKINTLSWACLLLALGAFLVASVFGLLANRLANYKKTQVEQLLKWRASQKAWHSTADEARGAVMEANARTIDSLRVQNNKRAKKVDWAQGSQLAAIFLLAVAIGSAIVAAGWGSPSVDADLLVDLVDVLIWPMVVLVIAILSYRLVASSLKVRTTGKAKPSPGGHEEKQGRN